MKLIYIPIKPAQYQTVRIKAKNQYFFFSVENELRLYFFTSDYTLEKDINIIMIRTGKEINEFEQKEINSSKYGGTFSIKAPKYDREGNPLDLSTIVMTVYTK